MYHWMRLALLSFLIPGMALAISQQVLEENLYLDFQQSIRSGEFQQQKFITGFTSFEQKLFIDALEDLAAENDPHALKALNEVNGFHYDLVQRFRLAILRIKYENAIVLPQDLAAELSNVLLNPTVERRLIYLLAAYESDLIQSGHADIVELAKKHPQYFDVKEDEETMKLVSDDVIADLFYNTPDVSTYMNGEYINSVKIFMFCRVNRLYPCLMIMKDIHGRVVRDTDGKLWSNKALASSSRGLPSYVRNGNTPAGVHTIDSVMPVADAQISFGKFRRFILNFVPKSRNEVLTKTLLPASSHNDEWWKPAQVARDIGRNLLRIHGTGKINTDPETPYYPFMRTSGCIAQRENTYDGVTYQDQRDLLDDVMTAMDLPAIYENETKVKGILYLVDLDEERVPVELEDLALRGIE